MKTVSFDEAMARKYPEWVVFVTTADENGCPDVMPAGWAMVASHHPPMFAISVGHTRYTHELIRRQKEFVVAFPGPGLGEAIVYTGSCSGRDIKDKFARSGLKALKANQVAAPLLAGCAVNLECHLEDAMEAGDHTVFLGRVVVAHVDEHVSARLLNFEGAFAVAVPENA